MLVGLTFEIRMTWKDYRLLYLNLFNKENDIGSMQSLAKKYVKKLWLPEDHIIFENAVLGKMEFSHHKYVSVFAKSDPKFYPSKAREDLYFNGKENELVYDRTFKMQYPCAFNFVYFPFDKQHCDFRMKIKTKNNRSIFLVEKHPAIQYEGPKILNVFQV